MFAAVAGTTISCSLGMQYRQVTSLSFFDGYEMNVLKKNSSWLGGEIKTDMDNGSLKACANQIKLFLGLTDVVEK
jgi:hypothetical protein